MQKLRSRSAHELTGWWRPSPSQIVLMAFVAFIALGALLLSLPQARAGAPHAWVDDLFMAASAVCVTGLTPLDPGSGYSLFGQVVLMLLFQIGGLGYMTLFTISMLLVGRRLSMRDRLTLQEAAGQPGMAGLIRFFTKIVWFTLAIEGLGCALLALSMVPEFGFGRGLYLAAFHSVSAFNNAGFSLLPAGAAHWQAHEGTLLVLGALVLVGGLGYNVNHALVDRYLLRRKREARWEILVTIVLGLTAALLLGAAGLFWLFEHDNPRTLGAMNLPDQLANAFFMGIQPRSGGFLSVDLAALERPTLMMTMVLMFIGAGPGGTAGGIKLTTLAIIVAAVLAAARGQDQVTLFGFKRTIGEKNVRKAFTVLTLSLLAVVAVTMLLGSIERHELVPLLFEVISAFGTVGLSLGVTPQLGDLSKLILVVTMLVGRVGVLVLMLSIVTERRKTSVQYMEEPLLIS